jgi:hypothetical protein
MTSTAKYALCLILSLTSGCATFNAKSECSWAKVITVSKDDVLTRLTKEEIVAHNEKVSRFCR